MPVSELHSGSLLRLPASTHSHSLHNTHKTVLELLKNSYEGHSRSSKVPPFDSLGMVSYSSSIATMAVTLTVSEIYQRMFQKLPNFLTLLYSAPPLGVKLSELSNDPR